MLLTALLGAALVLSGRGGAATGLLAGSAVAILDVLLLARTLSRFGQGPLLRPGALATGVFTRFLAVGSLLGLVLCVRTLSPLGTLIGFLLMPLSLGLAGASGLRGRRVRPAP